MKQIERLKEIEKLWKSIDRNKQWDEINWESYVRTGQGIGLEPTDDKIGYFLRKTGFIIWSPGIWEFEGMEDFQWDTALLDWLHVWYCLPEHWELPFFLNEPSGTICIPYISYKRFKLLFHHPASVALGLEHLERAEKERNAELHETEKSAKGGSKQINSVSKEEAKAFLEAGSEDEKEDREAIESPAAAPAASPRASRFNLPPTQEVK